MGKENNHEEQPEAVEEPIEEFKDKYFRQLAETENMRKRMQKEKLEMSQFAIADLVTEFLHPIDHLENALKHVDNMSDEIKNWGIGFKMILTQFKDVLSNHGVTTFQSEGTPFDPHLHEAIEMKETEEYLPGIVVEEHLKGYKMGERTIRPARVVVAKAPIPQEKEEEQTVNVEKEGE